MSKPRIMRRTGESCHRCGGEIQVGERWYRYDGVRCTDSRKIYHFDIEKCWKKMKEMK